MFSFWHSWRFLTASEAMGRDYAFDGEAAQPMLHRNARLCCKRECAPEVEGRSCPIWARAEGCLIKQRSWCLWGLSLESFLTAHTVYLNYLNTMYIYTVGKVLCFLSFHPPNWLPIPVHKNRSCGPSFDSGTKCPITLHSIGSVLSIIMHLQFGCSLLLTGILFKQQPAEQEHLSEKVQQQLESLTDTCCFAKYTHSFWLL